MNQTIIKHRITSFAKRGTRKLSSHKKFLAETILPEFIIQDQTINTLINSSNNKILEIGFGAGEFLFKNAQNNPNNIYIGCEPYLTGVLQLVNKIHANNISNIHIFNDDVFLLLAKIPDNFFDKIYILFPDPWPKSRHHKRRIIKPENLTIFCQKIKNNGSLKIATDHYDYASWIISHLINFPYLNWQIDNIKNIYREFPEYFSTKYYRKAKTDKKFFFDFKVKK